ncbi:flagellin [Desulfonispora thiosulfatigenes DSM 11270]|uniref:Flagellin n=1 Tax=Desulfonispora thiosulfatigenes DSM 11270 TaxID=656914 RepID=A0A1W1UNS3_DESTI|nr:flagellin [Desulfonispora thiosulfatigenes]SMB82737.1 flagellin [Desulfonispora thiosulfatigenes DSM 11270]
MRINHNIAALNTYRQMSGATNAQSKSMEKLSSGLRINRAGDDAAGLAISEKMRGQIRGLDQAAKNSQDGISMIQTAEGALNETHSILQRMRELATQASNDTNVDVDRNEIQKEMNQLTSEINRIGNTTEFNTQALLKGDGGKTLDGIGVAVASLGNLTGGEDIKTVEATSTTVVGTAADATSTLKVTLNGQAIDISFAAADTSSKPSHEGYNVTQNSASVNIDGSQTVDETAAGARDALQKVIDSNDVLKGNYVVSGTGANVTVSAVKGGKFEGSAGDIALAVASGTANISTLGTIGPANKGTTTAAVQATKTLTMPADADVAKGLEGKGITIGDVTLEFYDANKGAYKGDAQGININGVTTKEGLTNAIVAQAKIDGVTLSNATNDLKVTANQGGKAGNNITTADGGVQENFKSNFQVGANQGQSMTIEIKDMRAKALGLTGKSGDDGFTSGNSVTNGTNNTVVEAALDVSSHETASASITKINDAIEKVSAQRSELGSYQNRLEHTIKNLSTSSENLTAAESRVRDVDMAKEIMESTKNGILAQAAQAMMAQANSMPQGVLQLLR